MSFGNPSELFLLAGICCLRLMLFSVSACLVFVASTERKISLLPSMAVHICVTTCDACAADHVVRFTRPSPSVFQPNRQRTILIMNRMCYRLVKSRFRSRAIFCALFLQDDIFKSTIAVTLKLADRVLLLLLDKMVPKRGQLTVPEAAAMLFQYHHPNQTAINRLYVYRPNSSSHHQNSLHFGIHLV